MKTVRRPVVQNQSQRRSHRIAAAISLTLCVSTLVSGCRTPLYVCNRDRPSPPPIVQVRFDDQRPKWERKYYLGGALDDVTFIPAERIVPPPWEQFREKLESRFEANGIRPTDMAFRVDSCRVIINNNQTDRLVRLDRFDDGGKYAAQTPHELGPYLHNTAYGAGSSPNPYSSCDHDDDDDDGAGLLVAVGSVAAMLTAYVAGIATYEGTRNVAHWMHLRPGYAGPPSKLDTGVYVHGTTFEMFGGLTVTMPNGEKRLILVRQHNALTGPQGPDNVAVAAAVSVGADQAAERAVRELLGLPLHIEAGPESSPTPVLPPGYAPYEIPTTPPPRPQVQTTAAPIDPAIQEETRRLEEANRLHNEAFLNQTRPLPPAP